MYRIVLACAAAALITVFCSAPSDAGPITQCHPPDPVCELIGEFTWTRDDFGDIFALNNFSTGALAGSFTSALVLLDGTPDSVAFIDDPIIASGSSEAFAPFLITLATLTFTFQGVLFSADLSEGNLIFDEFVPNSFQSTLIYASAAVPEPSIVLLAGSGIVAALRRRRRLNGFH